MFFFISWTPAGTWLPQTDASAAFGPGTDFHYQPVSACATPLLIPAPGQSRSGRSGYGLGLLSSGERPATPRSAQGYWHRRGARLIQPTFPDCLLSPLIVSPGSCPKLLLSKTDRFDIIQGTRNPCVVSERNNDMERGVLLALYDREATESISSIRV